MVNETALGVSRKTKRRIDKFKSHPRQTYDDILNFLLLHCEEEVKQEDLEVFKEKNK